MLVIRRQAPNVHKSPTTKRDLTSRRSCPIIQSLQHERNQTMPKTIDQIVDTADTIYVNTIEVDTLYLENDNVYVFCLANGENYCFDRYATPVEITKTINGMQPVFRTTDGYDVIITASQEVFMNLV